MGLRPQLVAVLCLWSTAGCYLSHEVAEMDAGAPPPRDAGSDSPARPDFGLRIDAGPPRHPIGELAVGAWRTCGMRREGTVVCWGDGSAELTEVGGVSDATHIASSGAWSGVGVGGAGGVCVVRASRGVRCAGTPWACGSGDPFDVPGLDDAVEVALARTAACALRASGTVVCWGTSGNGELGFVSPSDSPPGPPVCEPQTIPRIDDAIHIAATQFGFCAARRSGIVSCWGDGTGEPGAVAGISDGIAVSSGDFCGVPSTCALRATGEVTCWGLSFWQGPLDPCDRSATSPPTAIAGITDAVAIATNGAMLCAVRRSGDVVCTGVERLTGAMGIGVPWHDLPEGTPQAVFPPTPMLLPSNDAVAIGVGSTFSCALLSDGAVYCSGANTLGQLGDGLVGDSLVPVPVLGL